MQMYANGGAGRNATHKLEPSLQKLVEPLQMTCPDCGPSSFQVSDQGISVWKLHFVWLVWSESKVPSNTWILASWDACITVTSVVSEVESLDWQQLAVNQSVSNPSTLKFWVIKGSWNSSWAGSKWKKRNEGDILVKKCSTNDHG